MVFGSLLDHLYPLLGGEYVFVSEADCVRRTHRNALCAICVETCPVGALTGPNPPRVNVDRCQRCGLCLHGCPTGVFSPFGKELPDLEEAATRIADNPDLRLACTRFGGQDGSLAINCIGEVSPGALLSFVALGARSVTLDTTDCHRCALASFAEALSTSAQRAGVLLEALGRREKVSVAPNDRGAVRPEPRQPTLYSRRQLLGLLRPRGLSASGGEQSERTEDHPPKRFPSEKAPYQRRLLAYSVSKLANNPSDTVSLHGFLAYAEPPASCSACGGCSRFCPTGALRWETQGRQGRLWFTPSLCVNCGICAMVCPEKSFQLRDEVPVASLTAPQGVVLLEIEVAACSRCGSLCRAAEKPLCFACGPQVARWASLA